MNQSIPGNRLLVPGKQRPQYLEPEAVMRLAGQPFSGVNVMTDEHFRDWLKPIA